MGVKELLRLAGLHPGQQTALKRALRDLMKHGDVRHEGKRFFVPSAKGAPGKDARRRDEARRPQRPGVEGILHLHRDGFGFVHPVSGEGDNVFVPPHEAARALDNDRVLVEWVEDRGRPYGRIVRVLERRRELVVGTYFEHGKAAAHVQPNDRALQEPIQVPRTQLARPGDLVKVRLGVGGGLMAPGAKLYGEVAGSLGKPGDPSAEVLSIAYAQGFNDEFPAEVMDEADSIPLTIDESALEGRRDLRALELVTIDGEDARDFDDAIYVEEKGGRFRLVVAIADVSHYVREGQPLDDEAFRRATSVYLPDRVLPMLPERLSNGICSLKPEEDRLCMVADLVIDANGALVQSELYAAVMRSAARCTYNEVHQVLSGQSVPHRSRFRPHFERAEKLAQVLFQMRQRRGAIDFDLPEVKVVVDADGKPERMVRRERLESHRIVEECMLAANEAVAEFMQRRGLPTVYRFHADPDPKKLDAFLKLAGAHGFHVQAKGKITSLELNELLEKFEGHREERALNQLLLRSMMQAVYSAENVGHYGLAAEHYLHFTSPIRRYPDLLVHRMLKQFNWGLSPKGTVPGRSKAKPRGQASFEAQVEKLNEMALHASERERAAMAVEREVISFYAALMMKDRVGEVFDATVSSLTDFGLFVELDELFVEGLVKSEALDPRYRFDTTTYVAVLGSGRRVHVGEKLKVRLQAVSLERRQMEFTVVSFVAEGPAAPEPRAAPARRPEPSRRPEPPEEDAEHHSPHPGFDRLRALAARGGGASRPPPHGKQGFRGKRGKNKSR